MEEDVEDASNGSAEVWDESLEAPFWVELGKPIISVLKPLVEIQFKTPLFLLPFCA